MTQKLIHMTEKELARHDVIKSLIDGKINGTDASKQIKRLKSNKTKLWALFGTSEILL